MAADDDNRSERPDEDRPKGILGAIPKRTLFRVLVLLGALAGIVYLRERTSSIAACMSNAFRVLPPPQTSPGPTRARIELHMDASAKQGQ